MPDREKVLRALEHHKETAVCNGCPYEEDDDTVEGYCPIYDDAIALLREQEQPNCEYAEHTTSGCLGYAKSLWDDEPIDVCKTCHEYEGNKYEEMSKDATN